MKDRLKTPGQILNEQTGNGHTPGVAYAFFKGDSIIYQHSAGYADITSRAPVSTATMFNIFSITKTFTALAILQMEEKGMLRLHDSVQEHLPAFPYGRG